MYACCNQDVSTSVQHSLFGIIVEEIRKYSRGTNATGIVMNALAVEWGHNVYARTIQVSSKSTTIHC